MSMKTSALWAALAAALLAGCANNNAPVRAEPTYQEAASSQFLQANAAAVDKLTAGFDVQSLAGAPVLVATVVNVNDLSRAAPLGRTLSEQYASALSGKGFNVREIKLRGDVFVKEGTGELLLSREIKDIARNQNAALVLVGTYSAAANLTYVSLKLVRTEDSRIVRGHDYALPNDRDVQRMLAVPR
ncbi:FlgO family outer membrane protein [Comamonas granuli]|uniref:FlgO family outer membrane protein n=1 Tax=Comamonas granuli TaxID=290309 RepID=UPI0005AAD6D5